MTEAKLYQSLPAKIEQLDLGKGTTVHHLPDWNKYDDPKKLEVLRKIAEMRGRDPRIAKLAVSIIKKAKVKPRDYKGQAAALLKWVQSPKNVYYVNEPGERLQDPIFTIKNGFGDCFAEDTLVLRDDMALIKIQNIQIGDKIWGRDQWTTVVNFWDKGVLPITEIALDNGSVLRLTEEHKVYVWNTDVQNWIRIKVSDLKEGHKLLQPQINRSKFVNRLRGTKGLCVVSITRLTDSVPCYDIATEDHYVYLPEADCTVSNCDDQNILLCSLFESVKLPWKYVISGRSRVNGSKMRYIEGDPYPLDGDWTHIYCMVGTPPFQPNEWYFCECTVEGVPLGWDVISGDHSFLPEMAKAKKGPQRIMDIGIKAPKGFKPIPLPKNKQWSPAIAQALENTAEEAAYAGTFQMMRNSGIGSSVGSSIATEMLDSEGKSSSMKLFDFQKIAQAVSTGVLISVATQLVLDYVRATDTWAKLARKK